VPVVQSHPKESRGCSRVAAKTRPRFRMACGSMVTSILCSRARAAPQPETPVRSVYAFARVMARRRHGPNGRVDQAVLHEIALDLFDKAPCAKAERRSVDPNERAWVVVNDDVPPFGARELTCSIRRCTH
jgi:hypothetical protein